MELTGLLSDSLYEVRIRAMNKQGWSQLSQPFFFKTSGINNSSEEEQWEDYHTLHLEFISLQSPVLEL